MWTYKLYFCSNLSYFVLTIICCRLPLLPLSCTLIPHPTLLSALQGCPTGPSPGEERNRKSKVAVVGLTIKGRDTATVNLVNIWTRFKGTTCETSYIAENEHTGFSELQIPSGVMFPKYRVGFVSVAKLFEVSFSRSSSVLSSLYT